MCNFCIGSLAFGDLALSLKMAACGGNSIASCSNVILHRNCRLACPRDYIILVSGTAISRMDMARCSRISAGFSLCENLRFRLRQGGNHVHGSRRARRQLRQMKASFGSPNDSAGIFQSFAILSCRLCMIQFHYSSTCSSDIACAEDIL